MAAINMFGLELLEKTAKNDIKRNEDNYVVVFHWVLVKEGFRCIGTGDAKEVSGDETQTELLPENWNENETYLLRYVKDGKLYIVRISRSGEDKDLLFNLVRGEDMKIASVIVAISETPEKKELASKFEKELVEPLTPSLSKPKTSSLFEIRDDPSHRDPWSNMDPLGRPIGRGPLGISPVGRSDLDPLGGFGSTPGGMIFPFPGSRPSSGVRFDPINPGQGPLAPRGQRRWPTDPDNDEFLPPGGGYFM